MSSTVAPTRDRRDTSLAERISVLSLLDPAVTTQIRPGLARSTCPLCGDRAVLIVTARDYRCDSCQAAGDVITFQMALHRMPYRTAVATLAVRAELAPSVEAWNERTIAAQYAMDCAAKFYREQFQASPTVQAYFQSRGFPLSLAAQEGIGYAPRDSAAFFAAMRDAKVSNSGMFDAGLVRMSRQVSDGSIYPFLRDRLVFPIQDTEDLHTIAFGGRHMDLPDAPTAATPAKVPKYLNSPNSVLYQKSATLVGLGAARAVMEQTKAVVVVEGYFTRLRLLTAGVTGVVAACGTSLTAQHAHLLALSLRGPESKVRCTALIFFDEGAEERAQAAALRIGAAGIDVEIAEVPVGMDDADTLGRERGVAAVVECIEHAVPPWLQAWQRAGGSESTSPSLLARIDAWQDTVEYLVTSRSRYARKEGTDFLSARYTIDRERLVEFLKARQTPTKGTVRAPLTAS